MTSRFCKKCMIPDFVEDKEQFLKTYIDQLGEDVRAEEAVYEKRLRQCKECGHMVNGVCRKCGCFVAVRAAVNGSNCPGDGSW